jgi:hypothetical protein
MRSDPGSWMSLASIADNMAPGATNLLIMYSGLQTLNICGTLVTKSEFLPNHSKIQTYFWLQE